MADFDEELKRQAAISSLLAQQPDTPDPSDSDQGYAESMAPVIKPDTQEDYHKLINQAFDRDRDHPDISPPPPLNIPKPTPESPSGPVDVKTDPDTGTPYVEDRSEGVKIPHAELATPADEAAFKPSDVVLPQIDVSGQGAPIRVERGEEITEPWHPASQTLQIPTPTPESPSGPVPPPPKPVPGFVESSQNAIVNPAAGVTPPTKDLSSTTGFAVADPDPVNPDYKTPLSPSDELKFQAWVKKNKVPFDDSASSDYDMRGFWKAAQEGDSDASTAVSKFDGRIHFNDKFKTPFHKTFSNESQYATADAPHWEGDRLIDNQGNVVADETPPAKPVPRAQPAAPRATIIQDPIVARSIAKNIADQNAPAPAQAPAPITSSDQTKTPVTQPDSSDDYNKLLDSIWPSAKTAEAAGDAGSVGTLEVGAGNRVDPKALFSYLRDKFTNSGLVGYVPPDGARWGIKTGSAAEWAAFGLAVAKQESDFNTTSYNASDPGGSAGIFQFGQGQTQFTKGGNQFNPQESADAFVRSVEHYVSGGSVANMGATFGSIRRPNEAGQYIPFAQSVAAGAPAGGATVAPAQNKMPWDDWAKLSPADQAAAEKEGKDFQTQQTSVLDKLNRSTTNPKQFWDILQSPIEGITDAQRQAYAENFKKEVTAYAQDFYGEKDPEKAFSRAVSDPGLEAYVSNVGRGLAGAVGQADIGIAQAGKSIDRNRVDGFMNLVHPDSTGEGRAGFVKALTDIQDMRHRHDVFNEIYGSLPQNTKDAIGDPASILDSIDHLADPKLQADLNKAIATKKAWVDQQLAGDPQLRGTGADWWTTGTGENLFNTVAALVPGGVGAVVRTSTLGAQMYASNMDRIAKEHPEYSPEQVSEEASKSAFMTLAPQEAVLAASHGLTAPLLKWAGALAEKPIVRFGIGGGVQVGAAAVGGAAGQVGSNIVENKPILQDVPQAAGTAVAQSLPFAVHGGIGALGHEVPAPVEHAVPAEPAPAEPAPAEPAPAEPAPSRPITRGEILGPDEPPEPSVRRPRTAEEAAYNQWYPNEVVQGQDPLVIRGAERTTWTPQELADLVDRAPSTPEGLKSFMEQVPSPTGLHLGSEGALEAEQTRQMRTNQPPITPAELLTRRAPVDLNTAIAQQRAAASLGGTPPKKQPSGPPPPKSAAERFVPSNQYQEVPDWAAVPPGGEYKVNMATGKTEARWTGEVPGPEKVIDKRTGKAQSAASEPSPVHVSESEPFTSKIANRYTADRMASGELGHVDPSQGKSTEELIGQGLKMTPDQREKLINNFSRGVGGDLDTQGAAIRSKEALLSVHSTEAGKAAEANPTNLQLKAEAEAALKAATDFHNGPVKKFKRVWSDAGRGLQREIPLDYTTLNGMKEAYMKGQGNGKEAPPEMEPKLKQTAARVNKSASDEQTAINNLGEEIGKRTRGKTLPTNDQIRTRIMEIMNDLPCRT